MAYTVTKDGVQKTYSDPVIYWPANAGIGLDEFELVVPVRTTGRIEIYKIPPCTAWPTGYWFALNTDTRWHQSVEPGCRSWEKTLLARVLVYDPTQADEEESRSMQNVLEYIHPDLKGTVDMDKLNPEVVETEV